MTATERPSPPEPSGSAAEPDWEQIRDRSDFQELRRRLLRFVFPMTALFLAWYLLYVLMASYAPAFMAIKLIGNINVGLVFGLLQFVSTFLITFLYVRFADRRLDPLIGEIRHEVEGRDPEGRDAEIVEAEHRDAGHRDVPARATDRRDTEGDPK